MMTREELIEKVAAKIFEHWQFQRASPFGKVNWVHGGNSIKQDEARDYARVALGVLLDEARAEEARQHWKRLCYEARKRAEELEAKLAARGGDDAGQA